MGMTDVYIKKFGAKMLVASKSINRIPDEYLKQAFNCRCTGAGIIPRKGKELLTNSTIGTNNKGGFVLNDILYQITDSKIFSIDEITGVQTEEAVLGYDARTDVLVYGSDFALIVSDGKPFSVFDGSTVTVPLTTPNISLGTVTITIASPAVFTLNNHGLIEGSRINLTTTGTLPTGLSIGTNYFIISAGLTVNDFQVSETLGGAAVNTSGIQSGVHSVTSFIANSGIIEFINSNEGYTLLASDNVLYISRPILPDNPEFAFDFIDSGAQQITYKAKIVSLKTSLSGVFIFTEDGRVEFMGAESLRDIAGSPTFLSNSIGRGGVPVSNRSVVASGDQLFYITKDRKINSINYLQGTDRTSIGKLSSVPVVGIDQLLNGVDDVQPNGEGFYNENGDTIEWHERTNNFQFNNITLVYDLVNKTFAVDTGKKYNYMVKKGSQYFGFSDLNSNIYKDDTGFSDAGEAIPFKIRTQAMNYGSIRQKLFGGMITAGGIGILTALNYRVFIDKQSVFSDVILGNTLGVSSLGEIGGETIGGEPIGGELEYISDIEPFERLADEGRIYDHGTRAEIEITSISQIQDFIIDMLGLRVEQVSNIDIDNKF